MKILFLFLFFSFVNLYSQNILLIDSPLVPKTDTSYVFIPKNYSSGKLPTVIMLHGYAGNYKQWNGIIDLQKFADSLNIVIACPDAFYDSYYINSPVRENSQYESFFWENFIPELLNKYPVDKGLIFITGLSMGGHGAISFYLKRPDMFVTAASTSGLLDLARFPNRTTIVGAAGNIEDYTAVWNENSCMYLLKNIVGKNKTIYIDCGTEDFLYETNIKFLEKCNELKIPITAKFQPGIHNHVYWRASIKDHFTYFLNFIKK